MVTQPTSSAVICSLLLFLNYTLEHITHVRTFVAPVTTTNTQIHSLTHSLTDEAFLGELDGESPGDFFQLSVLKNTTKSN